MISETYKKLFFQGRDLSFKILTVHLIPNDLLHSEIKMHTTVVFDSDFVEEKLVKMQTSSYQKLCQLGCFKTFHLFSTSKNQTPKIHPNSKNAFPSNFLHF